MAAYKLPPGLAGNLAAVGPAQRQNLKIETENFEYAMHLAKPEALVVVSTFKHTLNACMISCEQLEGNSSARDVSVDAKKKPSGG